MAVLEIKIPKGAAGAVIGRGGENVKEIKRLTGVWSIQVDNVAVDDQKTATIRGPTEESCGLARREVESAVALHRDRKQRARQSRIRGRREAGKNRHDPPACSLCGSQNTSMDACIKHLAGKLHAENVGGLCLCAEAKCEERDSPLETMLSCPAQRDVHLSLGFKVDEILAASAEGAGVGRSDGALEAASLLPPDPDWLIVESRRYVGWDGKKIKGDPTVPLSRAAPIKDSIARLRVDELPPEFRVPPLPALLPVAKKIKDTKLVWPHRPGVALPLALSKLEDGLFFGIDVVASTSFIYAMWGHSQTMKDTFLVQRLGKSIVVQHQKKRTHSSVDIGMLAEDLCCPSHSRDSSSYSLSKIRVGDCSLLIVSEVDGYDRDARAPVELKTRKGGNFAPKAKELMQCSVNGSSYAAVFKRSADGNYLESMATFSVEEMRERHSENWVYAGRRIKHVLGLFLENPSVRGATESPVLMSFDDAKLPVFTPAPPGSSVIASDYET